jgi:hypothetical protein
MLYYRLWLGILWQSVKLWFKTHYSDSWEIALYLILGNYMIISGHAHAIEALLR